MFIVKFSFASFFSVAFHPDLSLFAGTHVYNPHLVDNRSKSSSVCKAGALVSPSSCLDGEPHGWDPVDTHSTPVPSSTGEAVGGLSNITSPVHHRNMRNPCRVAEQEFRTTTQTPASQPAREQTPLEHGSANFSDEDWLNDKKDGYRKMRFQYCMIFSLLFFRASQGYTCGNLIVPVFHTIGKSRFSAEDVRTICTSILKSGLIAGGRVSKEGRQKPSSHLSTRSVTIQTKKNLAMTSPRREKYTITVSGRTLRTQSFGSV